MEIKQEGLAVPNIAPDVGPFFRYNVFSAEITKENSSQHEQLQHR